jgi:hypothetical protein
LTLLSGKKKRIEYLKQLKPIDIMKLTLLIIKLIQIWSAWIKHDIISRTVSLPTAIKYKSAKKCEVLIRSRYETIKQIDELFEEKI